MHSNDEIRLIIYTNAKDNYVLLHYVRPGVPNMSVN